MKHQSKSKVRSDSTKYVHDQNAEKELAQKTQGSKFRHVTRVKRKCFLSDYFQIPPKLPCLDCGIFKINLVHHFKLFFQNY